MVQVHAYPHKMHVQSQFHNKISGSELNFLFFPPLYDRYSQVENALCTCYHICLTLLNNTFSAPNYPLKRE